jgi:hypothetical protein
VRRSKPRSSGSIRVKFSGLPHLEQGGRRASTNLKSIGFIAATQRLYRWNRVNSAEENRAQRRVPSDRLTVLLRIDGCRRLLQHFTFISKTVLAFARHSCRAFAVATRRYSRPVRRMRQGTALWAFAFFMFCERSRHYRHSRADH